MDDVHHRSLAHGAEDLRSSMDPALGVAALAWFDASPADDPDSVPRQPDPS